MIAGSTLERVAQRPVADEGELALAPALECTRQPQDVLPLAERADAEEARPGGRPAHLRPRLLHVAGGEPLEVDAAVDHGALRPGVRHDLGEAFEKPSRHHDDRVGAPHGESGRGADGPAAAGVLDVLPVSCHDERGAPRDAREQARGNEKMGVDDIGTEAARRLQHVEREPGMPAAPAGPIDDRSRDLVTASLEGVLQRGDERAEGRGVGPRVHLRDEQDPHATSLRSTAVVRPPELAQGAADLADGAAGAKRLAERRQEVAAAGRGLAHRREGARRLLVAALGAHAGGSLALALLACGVDPVELDVSVGFLR